MASLTQPDPTPVSIPGLNTTAVPGDVVSLLVRNSLVLALHATACVAGFIAGSSLPLAAGGDAGSCAGSTSVPGRWPWAGSSP